MATKKQVASTRGNSTSSVGSKPPAQKPVTKKQSAAGNSSAEKSDWSNDEIGRAAGELWHALSDGRGQSLAELKKAIDSPPDLVLAAVGWLAREGKLEFASSGRTVKVSLR